MENVSSLLKTSLRKAKKKKIIVLPLLFLFALLPLFLSSQKTKGGMRTITLTKDGFVPNEIEIEKGDSVRFISTVGKPFWPASNIHPTHLIYPEFDPKRPIDAQSSWTFQFNKAGRWMYHNHLDPSTTGTIVVLDNNAALPNVDSKNCQGELSESAKEQCFQSLILLTMRTQGLSKTMDTLYTFYTTIPGFSSMCHGLTHIIGYEAYNEFADHKTLDFSPKISFCGFGFFHGFMETLMAKGGTAQQAGEFCKNLQVEIGIQSSQSLGSCFHGIGHGTMNYAFDQGMSVQQAINLALSLCKKSTVNNQDGCESGLFNSLKDYFDENKSKHFYDPNNPYKICDEQKDYHRHCYLQMTALMDKSNGFDFLKSAQVILSRFHGDSKKITPSISSISYSVGMNSVSKTDFTIIQANCLKLPSQYVRTCIQGVIDGLVEYGKPDYEYDAVFSFCQTKGVLSQDYITYCYQHAFVKLHGIYKDDKISSICTKLDPRYRAYCSVRDEPKPNI